MPNAPAIFSASAITELIKLDGRAKVTYPNAGAARRIERSSKIQKAKWPLTFDQADDEFPNALLKAQQKVSEDAQWVQVVLRFEELPYTASQDISRSVLEVIPQNLKSVDEGESGPWTTTNTRIDPATTATPDALSPFILSSTIAAETQVEGTKTNITRVGLTLSLAITAASASGGNVVFSTASTIGIAFVGSTVTIDTGVAQNDGAFTITAVTGTSFTVANTSGVTNTTAGTCAVVGGWMEVVSYRRDELGRIIQTILTVVAEGTQPTLTFNIIGASVEPWGNGQALQMIESIGAFGTFTDYEETGASSIVETLTTYVPSNTIPSGFPSSAANVISDVIRCENLQQAKRELKKIVNDTGTDRVAPLPLVGIPLEYHPATKALVYRDYQLVVPNFTVPALNAAWAGSFGAGLVVDARLTPIGDSPYFGPNAILEIEYVLGIPPAWVEFTERAFEFPAIFTFATNYEFNGITFYYAGFPPPWPGDGKTVGTFQLIAHRAAVRQARVTHTFSAGPSGVSPSNYKVVTPGVSSRLFQIPSNCIHQPVSVYGSISSGGGTTTVQIENIPASNPSQYSSTDVLVVSCEERPVLGLIYERVLTEISEDTSPYDFDPVLAEVAFNSTSPNAIVVQTLESGELLWLASDNAGDTQKITICGSAGGSGLREVVTLTGTTTVSTKHKFQRIQSVHAASAAVGNITINGSGVPPAGTIEFLSLPLDGDEITIGRTAGTQTYRFKSTPAAANDVYLDPTLSNTAQNLAYAINGTGVSGSTGWGTAVPYPNYYSGSTATANIGATLDTSAAEVIHVQDTVLTYAASQTYSLSQPVGSSLSLTAFTGGANGPQLAKLTPGQSDAYRNLSLYNASLLASSAPVFTLAGPVPDQTPGVVTEASSIVSASTAGASAISYNIPPAVLVVSDWVAVPSATGFSLQLMLLGVPGVTPTYEISNTGTEPHGTPAIAGSVTLPVIGSSQIFQVACSDIVSGKFVRVKFDNTVSTVPRALSAALVYEVAP